MIDKPNLKNMTKKIKKAPTFKYGIEITKPFSKAMYAHNDGVSTEMRDNILKVWTNELLKMKEYCDVNAMTADWDAYDIKSIAPKLLAIQKGVQAIGYGSGYSLDMVDKEFRNELETMANWQLHENYSYLCFEGLVERTTLMMVGFDWEKMDYSTEETDWIPCSKELDIQMANESENIQ
jgi:hypothetical protein